MKLPLASSKNQFVILSATFPAAASRASPCADSSVCYLSRGVCTAYPFSFQPRNNTATRRLQPSLALSRGSMWVVQLPFAAESPPALAKPSPALLQFEQPGCPTAAVQVILPVVEPSTSLSPPLRSSNNFQTQKRQSKSQLRPPPEVSDPAP